MVPFISSTGARIMSVFLSNPLSVLETRYEFGGHERWHGGVVHNLLKIYQGQGIKGFWKGGLATCYKEGIFAGAYYTLYQEGKAFGINAFIAGMVAGMISTTLTHPLEIIRAEIQSFIFTQNETASASINRQIQVLFKSGEAFRGLAPRVIKKPLTNTLAFLLFESM